MREVYNQKQTTLNTNDTGSKTTSLEVESCSDFTFFVFAVTGEHVNHIIEVYGAGKNEDGKLSDFVLIASSGLTGVGCKTIDIKEFSFIQLRVTTPEGVDSSSNILANPYRTI